MSLVRNGDTTLTNDDNTTDDYMSYIFCMGLMVTGLNNHFITIEPIIVGKGLGNALTSSILAEQCE